MVHSTDETFGEAESAAAGTACAGPRGSATGASSTSALIGGLAASGSLDDDDLATVRAARADRDRVAHGQKAIHFEPSVVDPLLDLATRMAREPPVPLDPSA